MPRGQAGFQNGYSKTDHILIINQVFETYAEYIKSLFMAFMDYGKTFDSVETLAVMEALFMHFPFTLFHQLLYLLIEQLVISSPHS